MRVWVSPEFLPSNFFRRFGQLIVECVGSSQMMHGSSTLGPIGIEGT